MTDDVETLREFIESCATLYIADGSDEALAALERVMTTINDERDQLSAALTQANVASQMAESAEADRDSLRTKLAKAKEALREAVALRVVLFRHGDIEGETDGWSDEKVAEKDGFARIWSTILAELSDAPAQEAKAE